MFLWCSAKQSSLKATFVVYFLFFFAMSLGRGGLSKGVIERDVDIAPI